MTQCEMILKYMQHFGSITPADAIYNLNCMRLAARIADLRARGYDINAELVYTKNKAGDPVHYTRYSLADSSKGNLTISQK